MKKAVFFLSALLIVASSGLALAQETPNMDDPAMEFRGNVGLEAASDLRNAMVTGESSAVACCNGGEYSSNMPLGGRMGTGRTGTSSTQDGGATQ